MGIIYLFIYFFERFIGRLNINVLAVYLLAVGFGSPSFNLLAAQ